jgi:23S rRNA (cytosine1962-C5)-methyltransferase
MLILTVLQKRIGPIKAFHPWVFSRALAHIPDEIRPGEPIRLVSEKGDFLANGYFNSYSQIAVRIWGYDKSEEIDGDFFFKRIEGACNLR